MNKNAFLGRNIEILFKNSINDHPYVINSIRDHFKIKGIFLNAISIGKKRSKPDVILEFALGESIHVSVKAYKDKIAFNQLTRASVSRFCKLFDICETDKENLQNLVIEKSKNSKQSLFIDYYQKKWQNFFSKNVLKIIKWAFSCNPSNEILALFNRDSNTMQLYPMKTIINKINKKVSFNSKGNLLIGECILFQRKGGNGSLSKHIPKYSIKHPGNDIQLKLKINRFINIMKKFKLIEYKI